eukprot:m.13362 g.13362  ORF g.13362 m.13362 type:complete len:216 (-) comp10146_c0_seq7:167-814(-)
MADYASRLHHRNQQYEHRPKESPPTQRLQGAEVLSSLAFQMLMYFNALYFPVWLLLIVFTTKEAEFPFIFSDFIGLILYSMLLPLEAIRLYLGHRGNLNESSPSLTSFLIASGLFEMPLLLIVMLRNSSLAFEAIANSILMVFLLSKGVFHDTITGPITMTIICLMQLAAGGIFLGFRAIVHLNRERSLRFQLLYQGLLHDEMQDLDLPQQESRF